MQKTKESAEIRYNECNLYNKKTIHSYDMKRTSI